MSTKLNLQLFLLIIRLFFKQYIYFCKVRERFGLFKDVENRTTSELSEQLGEK